MHQMFFILSFSCLKCELRNFKDCKLKDFFNNSLQTRNLASEYFLKSKDLMSFNKINSEYRH